MAETVNSEKLVGPVLNDPDMFAAVEEAAAVDNPDVEITVADHTGYFRVQAPHRLRLTRESLEEALGRPFQFPEFEESLVGFAGHINSIGDDEIVFYLDHSRES